MISTPCLVAELELKLKPNNDTCEAREQTADEIEEKNNYTCNSSIIQRGC